ncbi:glycosyltransferase family 2 protein [Spirosoma utsteinense]|uniref:Glycosyltransferase involved in cell wall biosynthesis n=1 Tax=Spirosoma utsteinense TaxID=2585773 RepID=A0ABR6WCK0_9BACT|nr:glycosyltransferase [Spirosoma utsteinense]MBC3794300.1 glycosyltransferase involved in cell wall biosynthesis [Spirosoma utsteinense]
MTPEFSVVIPTHQHPAFLLKCLDALGRQRLARNQFEIIVVDDGDSSSTATAVALFSRQVVQSGGTLEVRYLAQTEPLGFAAARNRGWRAARGRVIAFIDDDCLPQPDWLLSASTSFQRGAQVVAGQLRLALSDSSTRPDTKLPYVETGEFISANCFCLKSALERVGGFEEDFDSAWRQDSDLQFNFIQVGIPISKCPEAVVVYPLRDAAWYTALANERKGRYDALLYKRHPALFRQRIETHRGLVLEYYASVLASTIGFMSALSDNIVAAAMGFFLWGAISTNMLWQRLPDNATNRQLSQTVLTTLAIPFLAIYWRLRGAIKYKVLYW